MFFWFVRDLFEYHQQSIALVEEGKLEKYYSLRVGHHILMLHPGPPSPPSFLASLTVTLCVGK